MLNKFSRYIGKFPRLSFYLCSALIAYVLANYYRQESAVLMLQIIGVISLVQITSDINNTLKHGFFGIKLLPAVGILAALLLDHPWTAILLAIVASLDKPLLAYAERNKPTDSNRASNVINVQHAPFIQMLDRYSVTFMIFILLVAGSVWVALDDAERFVQVIAASSTAPLLLAPVMAYMRGIIVNNKQGVVFTSATTFERFARTASLLMYNRGVITTESTEVLAVKGLGKNTVKDVIQAAAALASQSEHPLARAITSKAGQQQVATKAKHAQEETNLGISGRIRGENIHIGRLSYLDSKGVDINVKFAKPAETVVYVAKSNQLIGYITFKEHFIEGSNTMVSELNKMKIDTTLISGSNGKSLATTANKIGISDYRGDLTPSEFIGILANVSKRPISVVGNPHADTAPLAAADTAVSTQGHVNGLTDVSFNEFNPKGFIQALSISRRSISKSKLASFGGLTIVMISVVLAAAGIGRPEHWAGAQVALTISLGVYAASLSTKTK